MRAIGCMRLSTALGQTEAGAVAVLHAALDAGVGLLDTADAYTPDGALGHNERLIAKALASWSGDRGAVTVATKGGLTRPGGQWVPDGRAKHLRAACEASRVALGVDKIALYQLHVVDPKTPWQTSVRALARLRDEGLVDRVGLCNVNLEQLRKAREIVDIASVQVSLGPYDDEAIRGGVVQYCRDQGIDVLAYRPLGGAKRVARIAKDAALQAVALRLGATPADVALAWIRTLDSCVIPLPGPTRIPTARACGMALTLSPDDCAELDARFGAADLLRRPQSQRRPRLQTESEVVIVMGMPGAGKSTHARAYVERGCERLNRDIAGGRLSGLVTRLREGLAAGQTRFVMDNTYGRRCRRNEVIEAAWRGGATVRCIWIDTPLARARVHAVTRMLDKYGKLLSPAEMTAAVKDDPGAFGPRVQTEYERAFEPPSTDEGFESVERLAPEPSEDPIASPRRALLLDVDRLFGKPPQVDAALREVVAKYVEDGFIPTGFAWRPERGGGDPDRGQSHAHDAALSTALGIALPVFECRHPAGVGVCWCRPPMPGLILLALRHASASAAGSVLVGTTPNAERYAAGAGVPYLSRADFSGR